MARVKRGVTAHKRHKRLLNAAEGRMGTNRKLVKRARESQLHALAYVTGEPVRLPGQRDRTAAGSPAGRTGAGWCVSKLERPPGGKAGRHAPPDGGDTPVTPDAAHRPGGEPETAADHRLASLLVSSPRSITRPGSVRCDVRRSRTASRNP